MIHNDACTYHLDPVIYSEDYVLHLKLLSPQITPVNIYIANKYIFSLFASLEEFTLVFKLHNTLSTLRRRTLRVRTLSLHSDQWILQPTLTPIIHRTEASFYKAPWYAAYATLLYIKETASDSFT